MISISSITANTAGNVIFYDDHGEGFKDISYNIEQLENLDGTICLANYGQRKREFSISVKTTISAESIFREIVNGSNVLLSCHDGLFYGAVSHLKVSKTILNFTFMVQTKDV